jgi:HEAT repeat protein
MDQSPGLIRHPGRRAGLAFSLVCAIVAHAQTTTDDSMTGAAAAAWAKWQPAMQAILDRKPEAAKADQAEQLFEELLAGEPSAFRIALLADRTINETALGGALLLLEQDAENKSLGPNAQRIWTLLETGREQMNEADDGWYFCAVGRFDVAEANFRHLLDSAPDPVALLEFTDRVKKRREILVQLATNPVVGESVRGVLKLLDRGEELIKADPARIKANITRLGDTPRAFENGVAWLKQSGEYAIPFIVQALRDPAQKHLTQAILRCLPQIDRPALNPLVVALRTNERVTQGYIVEALGKMGYPQAIPYLLQLQEKGNPPPEVAAAIGQALSAIASRNPDFEPNLSAAEAFYRLAEAYFKDQPSLAADPRLDTANIWYWRDDLLQNVSVPTQICNEVMCMRGCEEALLLNPDLKSAQALWVAVNFRRQAQLPEGQTDRTRPEKYPTAAYFAQTSGPGVCLTALARALDEGDPAIALGVIAALRNTAGPASLVTDQGGRLPLAEALSFPDRMVRIRAALALGSACPTQPFHNYQNLMPVLSEALMLFGGARHALVVDPDQESANQMAGALRAEGYQVQVDAEFLRGLQEIREVPSLDVIFLASNVPDVPLARALRQLRDEFRFGATPVVIVSKPGNRELVRDLVRADHRLGEVVPGEAPDRIKATVERISHAVGVTAITPEVGTALALEAAQTLRLLALTSNPLFSASQAQPALIAALASKDPDLRLTAAQVLGYLAAAPAQEAIARIALDQAEPEDMRVKMFAVLADAAKQCGNQLGNDWITRLIAIAERDENLVIRTAASQALGALNLPANKGSEIIRNQYGG